MRITINVPGDDEKALKLATVCADIYIGSGKHPSNSFVVSSSEYAALIEKKKNGNWSVKMQTKGVKSGK